MPTDCDPSARAKAALDRLATFVFQRDPSVLSEFTDDALLVGSERGEIAAGRAQLQSFFQQIFQRPARFSWEWEDIRASATDDLCWFFAEGVIVLPKTRNPRRRLQHFFVRPGPHPSLAAMSVRQHGLITAIRRNSSATTKEMPCRTGIQWRSGPLSLGPGWAA